MLFVALFLVGLIWDAIASGLGPQWHPRSGSMQTEIYATAGFMQAEICACAGSGCSLSPAVCDFYGVARTNFASLKDFLAIIPYFLRGVQQHFMRLLRLSRESYRCGFSSGVWRCSFIIQSSASSSAIVL